MAVRLRGTEEMRSGGSEAAAEENVRDASLAEEARRAGGAGRVAGRNHRGDHHQRGPERGRETSRNGTSTSFPHRALIKQGFDTADDQRVDVETAFKDPDHPFRVAIVCAMWMTGFDVECLSTLYIDKPMKAHTLMQAIARANRVYPEQGLRADRRL